MARNTKKYVYLTIGILRGSETHKALLADAEEHDIKQLPKLASVRLGDYYKGAKVVAPAQDTQHLEARQENAAEANEAWPE